LRLKWRLPALDKNDLRDEVMATRSSVCEIQLQQALDKSELADVKLMVDGMWVASGHRGVLSGRSVVFARMLANETEEKNKGIIKLDDVTVEGLLLFLEFIYLGKCALQSIVVCVTLMVLFLGGFAVELQRRVGVVEREEIREKEREKERKRKVSELRLRLGGETRCEGGVRKLTRRDRGKDRVSESETETEQKI